MDRVRVLRILEYEGPREWVEETLKRRAIKGEHKLGAYSVIKEAILGEFSTLIKEEEKEWRNFYRTRNPGETFRFETSRSLSRTSILFENKDPKCPMPFFFVSKWSKLSQAAELDITIKPA